MYITYSNSSKSGLNIFIEGKEYHFPINHIRYKDVYSALTSNFSYRYKVYKITKMYNELKTKLESCYFSIKDGELLYNNIAYDNLAIEKMINEIIENGCEALPLLRFMEKLEKNPIEQSRESVLRWMGNNGVAIDKEGNILGFKYVKKTGDNCYTDCHTEKMSIKIDIPVEMPRHEVELNDAMCSASGLHVGTYDYVKTEPCILLVKVDPTDIVSVPKKEYAKIRCCRYTPIKELSTDDKLIYSKNSGFENILQLDN